MVSPPPMVKWMREGQQSAVGHPKRIGLGDRYALFIIARADHIADRGQESPGKRNQQTDQAAGGRECRQILPEDHADAGQPQESRPRKLCQAIGWCMKILKLNNIAHQDGGEDHCHQPAGHVCGGQIAAAVAETEKGNIPAGP